MTTHATLSWPIVGAYYRPPAKAILQALAPNHALTLRSEPSNPVDPNAVQVWVTLARQDFTTAQVIKLDTEAQAFGHTAEDIFAQGHHHIGYVTRASNAELSWALIAWENANPGADYAARLTFGANGAAQATAPLPQVTPAQLASERT